MRTTKKAVEKAAKARKKSKTAQTARQRGDDGPAHVKMGGKTTIGLCQFCLKSKPLLKSHIIPKFHMRNQVSPDKRHAYHINISLSPLIQGQGQAEVWGEKRQDLHMPLFCASCEQKFSQVESSYSTWWKRLRLEEKTLKRGEHYTVDRSGHWSESRLSNIRTSPFITLTGVDMELLKRMQLINIFRLHCYLAAVYHITDYPAVDKYRRIISRFLDPDPDTVLDVTHLADFSVKPAYVFILSGEQFREGIAPNEPLDILPATPLTMGVEIMMHGDGSCFIGPILWRVKEEPDEIGKTSLTMGSTLFHYAFPYIADNMVKYDPSSRRSGSRRKR